MEEFLINVCDVNIQRRIEGAIGYINDICTKVNLWVNLQLGGGT